MEHPPSPPKDAPPQPEPAPNPEREANRRRFEIELEFVQALASPYYLETLAQRGYFQQESFINYLKYLLYWKDREYVRFIAYPHALHHLDLLQHETFRIVLSNHDFILGLDQRQFQHWRTWRNDPKLQPKLAPNPHLVRKASGEEAREADVPDPDDLPED